MNNNCHRHEKRRWWIFIFSLPDSVYEKKKFQNTRTKDIFLCLLIKQINNENAFAAVVVDNGVEFDISNFHRRIFFWLDFVTWTNYYYDGIQRKRKKIVKKTQEFQNTWPTSNNRKKNNLIRDLWCAWATKKKHETRRFSGFSGI